MSFSEQAYIALCRKQIEEKFAFGNGNGYTQRDLELLTRHIEEKTGIVLSLSTLKRLWKDNFKQSPQMATLNALAAVLDYRDWQDFKLCNRPPAGSGVSKKNTGKKNTWLVITFLLVMAAIAAIVLATRQGNRAGEEVKVNGPVHFTAQKTVTSGTPATVIFDYDVSRVAADSFFIQQSWNPFHRIAIDPASHTAASIYYSAGYHRARLIAGDSVLAMQPVHILSEGWEPRLFYSFQDQEPVTFRNERLTGNGRLQLGIDLLKKKNVDLSRPFQTRITNSRVYHASSDNFNLVSRIKTDSVTSGACAFMQVMIVTEKHIFWVNLQNKGCELNASYKMGEITRFGNENDLSRLGVNVHEWQEIGINVKNKHAEISLNGERLFRETFKEDFGDIMALTYIFNGTSSIDRVHLEDARGKTVFEDSFD